MRERLDGYVTALEHAFKSAGLSDAATAPAAPTFAETLPPAVRATRPVKKPMGVPRA